MKRTDLTNLGGLKFTQNRLAFMQEGYIEVLKAMAKMCGDKSILFGVEVTGGNVSSGFISYGGEPLMFIGGSIASKVVITESSVPLTYQNNVIHNVHFDKTATCGAVGDFDFSELMPIPSLCNIWLPNEVKELYVPSVDFNAFIAANFNVTGYGLNRYKGWRIMSKAVPDSAGKMFINIDFPDPIFCQTGMTGGAKNKTLVSGEQGSFTVATKNDDIGGGTAGALAAIKFNGNVVAAGAGNAAGYGADLTVNLSDATTPFSLLNPYFTILKIIKL